MQTTGGGVCGRVCDVYTCVLIHAIAEVVYSSIEEGASSASFFFFFHSWLFLSVLNYREITSLAVVRLRLLPGLFLSAAPALFRGLSRLLSPSAFVELPAYGFGSIRVASLEVLLPCRKIV